MRFVSWNVNGFRSCLKKGFEEFFTSIDADFFCIQECKAREEQVDFAPSGYRAFWHSADRPGYAGTVTYSKHEPLNQYRDLGIPEIDGEGRVLTLEYPEFFLVNVYTPNSQRDLARLPHRMIWEDACRAYLCELDLKKPVIICGDLNVAHQEIDIKNAKSNHRNAGFTDQERGKMTELLDAGFVDTYRHFYPEKSDAYTWWSNMPGVRQRNVGWRIDYFIISQRLLKSIEHATIYPEVLGSDHCPVGLIMK